MPRHITHLSAWGRWYSTLHTRHVYAREVCAIPWQCHYVLCIIVYVWQLRSDFIASETGASPPLSAQEECLGLAVLDLWRMAKERHQSVKDLCKTVRCHSSANQTLLLIFLWERLSASSWSLCRMTNGLHSSYKSCLPRSHRMEIQKRNVVDRYRIRTTLKHFLKKLGSSSVDEYSLKLKYLIELTGIVPTLGSETYQVNHFTEHLNSAFSHVRVNGETGIQTCSDGNSDGAQVRKLQSGGCVVWVALFGTKWQ